MRVRRGEHDPGYFDYESNGVGVGEAKPRDMTNAEKAELRKREAKRVPLGFQLPAKSRSKR
jgi:hypothetical protein